MVDTGMKDELVRKIAQEIAASPKLDPDWKALSLVFTFEGDALSNFGYSYTGDGQGDWSAFSSTSDELEHDLIKLREVMQQETNAAWRQGLFQLLRDQREIKFEFAYNGEARWKVTPGNLDKIVRELRPRP